MEVIKNNYNHEECRKCHSILKVEDDDFMHDAYGRRWWICPLCGEINFPDGEPDEIEDGILFPHDFYHYKDGVDITDDEINKWIKRGTDYFTANPNEPYYYTAAGNSFVIVINNKDDEEYYVIVTKNYYDTYIPYS